MIGTEFLGYFASALIIISFMLNNMFKLRLINTAGCAFFVAYGIALGMNWPIIITNVFIMGVNVYYLLQHKKQDLADN